MIRVIRSRRRFVLATWVGLAACVSGADFQVRTWSVDEGLLQNSAMDIAQTPEGYLVLGSLFGDLVRFDGVRFARYDFADQPDSGQWFIARLSTDSQGGQWFYRREELMRYQAGRVTIERAAGDPASGIVEMVSTDARKPVFRWKDGQLLHGRRKPAGGYEWKTVQLPAEDRADLFRASEDGSVWYRRADGRLGRVVDGAVESPAQAPGLNAPVLALETDAAGRLWARTREDLACWDGQAFRDMTPTNGEPVQAVEALAAAGDGSLWLVANGRLRRCRDRQWLAEAKGAPEQWSPWPERRNLVQGTREGGIWLARPGEAGLVYVHPDGALTPVTQRDGLPGSMIGRLFVDREDNLWVGYLRTGLARVQPRLFTHVGGAEGLRDAAITSVCEDGAGDLWMGTLSGQVQRWRQGASSNFTLFTGAELDNSSLVCADEAGRVLVGSGSRRQGVWRFENGAFRQLATSPNIIWQMHAGSSGRTWMAGSVSVWSLDGDAVRLVYRMQPGDGKPSALAETSDGSLWLGTANGKLLRLADQRAEAYLPQDRWGLHRIWAMLAEDDGGLWLGTTGGGLLHFRAGRFTRFTTEQGLPSDTIAQLLDDGLGHLWMGTQSGFVRVSKAALADCAAGRRPDLPCRLFDRGDGLRSVAISSDLKPNCSRARDGRLWFAMANGVVSVDPAAIRPQLQPPVALIEEARVIRPTSGAPAARDRNATAGAPIVRPSPSGPLIVSPGTSLLEIRYTGLSLTAPESLRFYCRMRGLDVDWNDAGSERTATYHHLRPGAYTFEVRARNRDDVWSAPASLAIRLQPHVWQTVWFRAGVLIALMALLAALVWWVLHLKHRRALRSVEQRQALERDRARIAQDLHDDLGAELSGIAMLSDLACHDADAAGTVRSRLEEIRVQAEQTVRRLEEIVWAVNPANDTLERFAGFFCKFAQNYLELAGIRARFDVPETLPDRVLASAQRHHLFLAAKEALHNAVRHGAPTEVIIRMALRAERLSVTVADNGRGFIDTPDLSAARGSGNMRRRMKAAGGELERRTSPGHGTEVVLTLPVSGARP